MQASSMARKNKSRKPEAKPETRTEFIFPWFHKYIDEEVSPLECAWYNPSGNPDKGLKHRYNTHVMGRFRCTNEHCGTDGWASGKVAILIRGYNHNGYNAVVFNQRCKGCGQLGNFMIDRQSYVDRVAYRIQKWAGIKLEPPHYDSKPGKPHKKHLCEGCKRGVCRQENMSD